MLFSGISWQTTRRGQSFLRVCSFRIYKWAFMWVHKVTAIFIVKSSKSGCLLLGRLFQRLTILRGRSFGCLKQAVGFSMSTRKPYCCDWKVFCDKRGLQDHTVLSSFGILFVMIPKSTMTTAALRLTQTQARIIFALSAIWFLSTISHNWGDFD